MNEVDRTLQFTQVSLGANNWNSFATGLGLQAVMVAVLVTVSFTAPTVIRSSYEKVDLVAPTLDEQPVRKYIPPRVKIIAPSRARLQQIAPAIAPPLQVPVEPKREIAKFEPAVPKLAPQPQAPVVLAKFDSPTAEKSAPKLDRTVKTDAFGSSAQANLSKSARDVQTGGFGDPNGAKPSATGGDHSKLAAVGSFELPAGPGQGNGTGGNRGAQGTVASTGFGNGTASEPLRRASQGRVQSASFDTSLAPATQPPRKQVVAEAPTTPVAIQSKPQPVYTAEARGAHIEGEVLVEALFSADGHVRVVRIVKPLGHGLDEAAVRAAEGIRFTPAMREGRAVDSKATLHIKFQLS